MNTSANLSIPLSLYSYQLTGPLDQITEKLPPIAWRVCELFVEDESRLARAQLSPLLGRIEDQDAILEMLLRMQVLTSNNISYTEYLEKPLSERTALEVLKEDKRDEMSTPFEPGEGAFAGKSKAGAIDVSEAFADSELVAVQIDEDDGGSFMID